MKPQALDWDAIDEELAAQNRASYDSLDQVKLKAKADAERQRAIANGWMDEEGNSLLPDDPEEEDEEESDPE